MLGEGCSSQEIRSKGKVCLFNHQGLFHNSGNQDTDCLHISACDQNTLSNSSSFCLLYSLVAGGAWCSPCQRQHQDVTRYREECGRVNSEPEHPCSMRCTAREAETLCLVLLATEWGERDRRSSFPRNPALLPLSTHSHPKVKGRGVLAAEESSPCQSKECSV